MRTMALSSSVTACAILGLAHEALTRRTDECNCLREEDAHRVPQGDRLLVDAARRLDLRQRGGGELDRRVQRERRELLALGFLHALGLLLRELAQAAHEILGIAPEGESEATATAAFHEPRLAVPCSAARPLPPPRPPRAGPVASRRRTGSPHRRPAPARAAAPPRPGGRDSRSWRAAALLRGSRPARRRRALPLRSLPAPRSRGARAGVGGAAAGRPHPRSPRPL